MSSLLPITARTPRANDHEERLNIPVIFLDNFGQLIEHITINCLQFVGTV